jgi:hypothetical protein
MACSTTWASGVLLCAVGLPACGGSVVIAADDDDEVLTEGPGPSTEAAWTFIEDHEGNDFPRAVAFDDDGHAWATGQIRPDGASTMWLVELDVDGTELFRDSYSSGGDPAVVGQVLAIIGGEVMVSGHDSEASFLRRYGAQGELRWTSQRQESVYGIVAGPSGSAFVTGSAPQGDSHVGWVAHLDADGEPLWSSTAGGSGLYGAAVDADGALVTMAYDDDTEALELRRYGDDGALKSSDALDCGGLFALGADGALATADAGELVGEPALCLYDRDLEQQWRIQVERPGAQHIGVQGLTVDPFGRIVASGFAILADDVSEMFVHTYDRDGLLLGEHAWRGPDGVFGYGFTVASDAEGGLVTSAIVQAAELTDMAIALRKLVPR